MPSLAVVVLSFEKEMYFLTEGDKPVEVCLITEGEGLPMHSISVPIKFINRTAICKCQLTRTAHDTYVSTVVAWINIRIINGHIRHM